MQVKTKLNDSSGLGTESFISDFYLKLDLNKTFTIKNANYVKNITAQLEF